jgi:hypothetical protein
MAMSVVLIMVIALVSQLDFVMSRFTSDASAANNVGERLDSAWAGLQVALGHPFGMGIREFMSYVSSGSAGTTSPHNGFVFFGGVFGSLPLLVVLVAFAANLLNWRKDVDVFFALLTLQVTISFFFEQLPGSYSYALVICFIVARAFLRTQLGSELQIRSSQGTRRPLTTNLRSQRRFSRVVNDLRK